MICQEWRTILMQILFTDLLFFTKPIDLNFQSKVEDNCPSELCVFIPPWRQEVVKPECLCCIRRWLVLHSLAANFSVQWMLRE